MSGSEFGFVAGCIILIGGIIAFFSLRQLLCGMFARVGAFALPGLAFAGLNLDFKREGGIIAGGIVLGAIPLGFLVSWVAAHLLLPKKALKDVPLGIRRGIGGTIAGLAVLLLVAGL